MNEEAETVWNLKITNVWSESETNAVHNAITGSGDNTLTTSSTPIFQNEECLECSDECIPDELLLMTPVVILKKLQGKEITNNSSPTIPTFLSEPLERINKVGFDPNFTIMDMKCQRCDQIFINKKCLIDHQKIVFEALSKNPNIELKCCPQCSFKSCNMIGLMLHKEEHKNIPSIYKKNIKESKLNKKESTTSSKKATDKRRSCKTSEITKRPYVGEKTTKSATSAMLNRSSVNEQLPSKRRRGPKEVSVAYEMSKQPPVVEKLPSVNEIFSESLIAIDSTTENINSPLSGEKLPSKKRGRPKKKTLTSEIPNQPTVDEHFPPLNEKCAEPLIANASVTSEILNCPSGAEHLPSKKRGTPKKDSLTSDMSNELPVVAQLPSANEKNVTETTSEMINRQSAAELLPSKKQGTLKKDSITSEMSNELPVVEQLPSTNEDIMTEATFEMINRQQSDVKQQPYKKRGRPKKHSVTSKMTNLPPLPTVNEKSTESSTVTASSSEIIKNPAIVEKRGGRKYSNSLPICEHSPSLSKKSAESLIATGSVTSKKSKSLTEVDRLLSRNQEKPKKSSVRPEKLSQAPIVEQLPSENDKRINEVGFDPNFTIMDMKCQRCDQIFINKKCLIDHQKSAENSELEKLLLSVSGKSIFLFIKIRFSCNSFYAQEKMFRFTSFRVHPCPKVGRMKCIFLFLIM